MQVIRRFLVFLIYLFINISAYSQYNWEKVSMPDTVICYGVDFDSSGNHFIATDKGVYSSIDDGFHWELTSLTEYLSCIYINSNNTIYSGMDKLFRSYDCGVTWDSVFYSNDGAITSIITFGDSCLFVGTWGGLYRSVDSAQTWHKVLNATNSEVIHAIASNGEGVLFAGSTSFIGGSNPGGVYRSEDNGATWALINLEYNFVSSIVINSDDEVFVGTNGNYFWGGSNVFRSTDNGISWDTVYENNRINSMDINNYNEIAIGCRTDGSPGGVFCSYDNGNTWETVSSNLPSKSIFEVVFGPDNRLYAIISAFGLYRTETAVETHEENVQQLNFYPNPAEKEVHIVTLTKSSKTKIKIIDIYGNQITCKAIVVDDNLINVDISQLVSGIYFIISLTNENDLMISKLIKY